MAANRESQESLETPAEGDTTPAEAATPGRVKVRLTHHTSWEGNNVLPGTDVEVTPDQARSMIANGRARRAE